MSMDRQTEEWLLVCYNFAAGSFHMKKLCSRLYSTEVEFYIDKTQKSLFEPPFGGLTDNVVKRTHFIYSIVRWKAGDRPPIRHN